MAKGKRDPDTRGSDASTLANPTLPVTALNNVRVYNISGNTHRSLPDWLVRRSARALKKDDEWTRRVELIQDLEFPEASIQAKFTRDGKYIIAAGTYKPQFRVFELAEMSMKFDRHTDAETVALEVLSEDWTKLVLLQADRAIELHGPCGLYQAVKTPRVGRAMFFDAFSCDLVVGASDTSVYRLNLDRGQFLASLETDQPSGCGVNAVARAPLHGLYGFGCENGAVEFWDRRDRRRVAALKLFGTDEQLSSPFEVSALTFLPDGITWAAGTSTGQVSLFDLRSSKPILTRDHHYGYPIKEVRHHAASGCLLSYDRKALRLWNRNTGSLLTTVEPSGGADLNHVAFKGDGEDGFLLCSVEDRQMQSFFIPELGPAPRWASFLENLTEEMEEGQKVCGKASLAPGAVYDNYKFVTRSELADLNMDHLIGTNVLRAYMHGFFIDLRLWEKARAIANPFAYEEYLEEQRRTKLEAERASRIKGATNVHPSKKAAPKTKVNSVLAERLAKQSELLAKLDSLEASEATRSTDSAEASTADESLAKVNKKMIQAAKTSKAILSDSRFAALFTNPDFGQDEASPEFKQFHAHPIKSEPDHEN
jgi:ribosome biogenesis protein ENP2